MRTRRQIALPVVSLWRDTERKSRERELLFGDGFSILDDDGEFAFGQSEKDGYQGYLALASLRDPVENTHTVSAWATHLYSAPDIKSPELASLSFGSRIRIVATAGRFCETCDGAYIPANHIRPADLMMTDTVAVAELFLGTPYLWGGNSCRGIDCSGLVQAALLACGKDCPADADQQERKVGQTLGHNEPVKRGDLFFWQGHVAIAVDCETIIHANANDMAVAYEGIDHAIRRISDKGEGPVTARKRP